MKKLWILSEIFYPNETSTAFIMTQIAETIHEYRPISIICCESENQGKHSYLDIHYCKKLKFNNKNKHLIHATKLFLNSIQMSLKLLKLCKKNDDIFIVTNPVFLLIPVTIVSKIKKNNLTVLVHDVFPENLLARGIFRKNNVIYQSLLAIYNLCYSECKNIVVIGDDMKKILEKKIKKNSYKIVKIENWGNQELYCSNTKEGKGNKITFVYAGNLGIFQNLLDVVILFFTSNNPNIEFKIYGQGEQFAQIKNYILSKKITNVYLMGAFTREQEKEIYSEADICIVSLIDNMLGLGVPSKTYNILSTGKPILHFGHQDSEISCLIKNNNLGWSFSFFNTVSIIKFFNNIHTCQIDYEKIKFRSTNCFKEHFTKEIILQKYKVLFSD